MAGWSELERGARTVRPNDARGGRVLAAAAIPGGLLGYLLLGGAVRPGFTDYWGYLVGQTALALTLLVLAEARLADGGGLSWSAHALAGMGLAADVVGNAARWYARSDAYDQLVHFLSLAAITTVLADGLAALGRRGTVGWSLPVRLVVAAAAAVALGLGWEVYEYVGDAVFRTWRSHGRWDTTFDVVCDGLGAVTAAALVWRREAARPVRMPPAVRLRSEPTVGD